MVLLKLTAQTAQGRYPFRPYPVRPKNMHKARFALLLHFLLTGCVASPGIRPLRALELATAPYRQISAEAHTGSLMYEGGCLIFSDGEKPHRLLPIWPDGTVFNGNLVTFHHPAKDDQRIAVGEEFRMEGEPVSWQQLPPVRYAPFRQQCPAEPFLVSNVRPAD